MAKDKNMLLKWLRDAHAMESSAESILEKQVKRVKDHPEVHRRIADHLEETRRQQTRLEDCINKLGGDTSVLKEMVGKFSGTMQALGAAGADDELVKAAISNYAFESMEIASYKSLIAAAEAYNEPEIRRVCEEILVEEERMAEWLENNVGAITRDHLSRMGVSVHEPSKPGPESRREPPRPRA
ncbi:ferritin-like domain-containing protein [Persicimonas caeni]|jgi:ferritin-like metal-binding protein YciE|uniref:Ferritin-like domain-containing protein n=1 Tax=Persicimonas caeni TaxID=2292766 RepID=A0A4Y6PVW1_PERCE|nr:ferritin-like domain-containing protein [Persicimonas caeni]QDG52383.1 ferritin-like domain-containing protein [Persicimonas caeni]QED33605.1 ferritin-like domain-containing protein [Persicimonas caeni]